MTTSRGVRAGRRPRTRRPAAVLTAVVAVALTSAGTWQLSRVVGSPASAPHGTARFLGGLGAVLIGAVIAGRIGRRHVRGDLGTGVGAVPLSGLGLSGLGLSGLGLSGLGVGAGLLISAGTRAGLGTAVAGIAACLVAVLLQRDESRRTAALRRLRDVPSQDPGAEGVGGLAVLLSLRDTGGSLNDDPSVILRARITPDDGSPAFDAEFRDTVPRIAIPRPGDTFRVRHHPTDPLRTVRAGAFSGPPPAPRPER